MNGFYRRLPDSQNSLLRAVPRIFPFLKGVSATHREPRTNSCKIVATSAHSTAHKNQTLRCRRGTARLTFLLCISRKKNRTRPIKRPCSAIFAFNTAASFPKLQCYLARNNNFKYFFSSHNKGLNELLNQLIESKKMLKCIETFCEV